MRELTQEEIDLAPDWATHYYVDFCGDAWFQSDEKEALLYKSDLLEEPLVFTGLDDRAKPIPRKAFDISGFQSPYMHEMEQPSIYTDDLELGRIMVDGQLDKQWVIAIAKALGVTGDDL